MIKGVVKKNRSHKRWVSHSGNKSLIECTRSDTNWKLLDFLNNQVCAKMCATKYQNAELKETNIHYSEDKTSYKAVALT
jgi:hypothetical protein